jgi:hypothetical protein
MRSNAVPACIGRLTPSGGGVGVRRGGGLEPFGGGAAAGGGADARRVGACEVTAGSIGAATGGAEGAGAGLIASGFVEGRVALSPAARGTGSSGIEGDRRAATSAARGGRPRCDGRARGAPVVRAGGGFDPVRPIAGSTEVFSSLKTTPLVSSASSGARRTT